MARYITKVPSTCSSKEYPPEVPDTKQCAINKKLPKIETRLYLQPLIASGSALTIAPFKAASGATQLLDVTATGIAQLPLPQATVVFQTDWESTDGATSIVEQSSNAATVTRQFGGAEIDNARAKFGSTSAFCGFAEDYWSAPDIAAYDMGSGNFCWESWVNLRQNVNTNDEWSVFNQWGSGGNAYGFSLRRDGAGDYFVRVRLGATIIDVGITNTTIVPSISAPGTWYHMVAERIGDTVYCGFNGFIEGSGSFSGTVPTSSEPLRLGGNQSGTWLTIWWLDDTRIGTNGVFYGLNSGSTYTAPTTTLPLP